MTTSIALIVAVALLVAGATAVLQGPKSKVPGGWPKRLLVLAAMIIGLFLVWLAMMVLVVGPSMRQL
jgi:hypothetical protein